MSPTSSKRIVSCRSSLKNVHMIFLSGYKLYSLQLSTCLSRLISFLVRCDAPEHGGLLISATRTERNYKHTQFRYSASMQVSTVPSTLVVWELHLNDLTHWRRYINHVQMQSGACKLSIDRITAGTRLYGKGSSSSYPLVYGFGLYVSS